MVAEVCSMVWLDLWVVQMMKSAIVSTELQIAIVLLRVESVLLGNIA